MENPHFQWGNPLLMAIFNSYFDITRGYIVAQCVFLFKTCPDLVARRRLEDGATSQAEAHGYNGVPPFSSHPVEYIIQLPSGKQT